jgi:hypothetical protein
LAVVQLSQYDKDNNLTKDILQTTNVLPKTVISIAAGTAQLQLLPTTVRYSISVGDDADSSYLGALFQIDCNTYASSYQIIYENRFGGFSVLRAKGHDKEVFKVKSNVFLAEKKNSTDAELSSEVVNKSRSFEFNTGWATAYTEVKNWYDVVGTTIFVIFPNSDEVKKMVVETVSFSYEKKNNLQNMTFTATLSNEDIS